MHSLAQFLLRHLVLSAFISSTARADAYPFDKSAQRDQALAELKRAYNPSGFGRHITAIAATGDLRSRLANISAPTLAVHGVDDLLVSPESGKDTAANIKGAELLIVEGMGHDFPPSLFEFIAAAIADNAHRAYQTL
jgi:pimeloyl-ACP methyl ester carboxylesterase